MSARDLDGEKVTAIVEQFKVGAAMYDAAYEDEDIDAQKEGIKIARAAIRSLDDIGTDGRKALIPLLHDPNPGIRVYAAGCLVKTVPDQAISVLTEIRDRCLTRTHMTAFRFLWSHENGGLKL
jgi:hypothetical protein